MVELLERADRLLAGIAALEDQINRLEAQAFKEMQDVRERYETPLSSLKGKHGDLAKDLIRLMKKNKGPIFDGSDQVDLTHGILLCGEETKVSIPRGAVAALEELGWEDGLKRSVNVDREAIEKWPDERLVQIGAEKKTKEVFSYELKSDEEAA